MREILFFLIAMSVPLAFVNDGIYKPCFGLSMIMTTIMVGNQNLVLVLESSIRL
jgi:hypothetical protein